jgi:hypothetical protein
VQLGHAMLKLGVETSHLSCSKTGGGME